MNTKMILFVVLICCIAMNNIYSQVNNINNDSWIKIDDGLLYNLVIVQDNNGTTEKGSLSGMNGDSLYLNQNSRQKKVIDLNKIKSLVVYDGRLSPDAILYGIFAGMYAGNLAFYTDKNLNEKYITYSELNGLALVNLLFITVGGSIGYLIDQSLGREKKVFYFSENSGDRESEIKSLKKFLSEDKSKGNFHINIDMSQVFTRISSLGENYQDNIYNNYSNNDVHSFNLLRKISLTYMFFENLELGGTICWFGEPNLNYYNYYSQDYYSYKTVKIDETYKAVGYFLIANYYPMNKVLPPNIEFSLGGGLGISYINFSDHFSSDEYSYPTTNTTIENYNNISENKISLIFMSRMNFHIFSAFYLSLQGDYVLVTGKKVPSVPDLSLNERNFGNLSIGLGLGLNF